VLVGATTVAFAVSEAAKTEIVPIYATQVTKVFSPICDPSVCASRVATVAFKLHRREYLEVWVESAGKRVATLVHGRSFPRGPVRLAFDGLAGRSATVLPDGTYWPVVHLRSEHRTITLPNPIRLVTAPPRVAPPTHLLRATISPNGDGRHDAIEIPYTLSGPAHAVLFVDGRQAGFTRRQKRSGEIVWNGKIAGQLQPPGRYRLALASQDEAGNRSAATWLGDVAISYLRLGRKVIVLHPQRRFALFVLTDSARISWLLGDRRGRSRHHTLLLRAPGRSGVYRLRVTAGGRTVIASVVVRAAPHKRHRRTVGQSATAKGGLER
jgi:hypothetical protein